MAEILHIEISRKHVSVTYDLDLCPKILKFCENTDKHTHKQTNKQTDMGITIPRPPPMGGEVKIALVNMEFASCDR